MTDKEYRYYKDNGKLMRLHIEQDDEPLDPRYDWDGQIGKMMCWHREYRLGDYKDNDYNDNEEEGIVKGDWFYRKNGTKKKTTANGFEFIKKLEE